MIHNINGTNLDFLKVAVVNKRDGSTEIFPKFVVRSPSEDLMIRGGDFYAVWVDELGRWSTNEQDLVDLVDREIDIIVKEYKSSFPASMPNVKYVWDADSGVIDKWHKYCKNQMRDSYNMLDETIIFSNTPTNKKDYASHKLSYPLEAGSIESWDKLIGTLYSPEERHKLEWAIGSIITGDSKTLQKFIVLYGDAGTGKSTILNVIQDLFHGYYSVFDAKALGSANAQFALEPFKTNPLVAIQHDGDLSRIEDNTRLNSLVSHEEMTVNEKNKSIYSNRFKCFLFMGTNKPVKITDAKSGLIRRLIDVVPSGNKLPRREYNHAVKHVKFELGAIAWHCKEVYLAAPDYYDDYIPTSMMSSTNDFYNYVMDSYSTFLKEDGTTLKAAYEMYKVYCEDTNVPATARMSRMRFKEELKNYFREFSERFVLEDGTRVRSYYSRFRVDRFETEKKPEEKNGENDSNSWLYLREGVESILDRDCGHEPAQYATDKEIPSKAWDKCKTTLKDIDTSKLHYVKVPENHIVIDFDLKNEKGEKDFALNISAASAWPATYAEVSKGGAGIHLHYIYTGDVTRLSRVYDDHIEVKIFTGKSSLRRKLTKCNDLPIATISSGLPLKGDDKLINFNAVQSERGIRTLIKRNLNKEIHPGTKPSIDFIFKILEDAYNSDLKYDVSDMYNAVFAFAAQSSNQAEYCMNLVEKMHFRSEDPSDNYDDNGAPIVFYDIEVFPNLFLVNWKFKGLGVPVVRMINPRPADIEGLLRFRLIGFNNRDYDNHILYAAYMGYRNEQLYNLSQTIINSPKGTNAGKFREAYNLSYTDVYDFAAKKQSLKKWEIELGIHHQELGLPWDEPVPEDMWEKVAEYCDNDVIATEAVFDHLKGDFTARKILAELSGLTPNDKTNSHTTRIIFGKEKHPQLVYVDLAEEFPGYEFCTMYDYYKNHPEYIPEKLWEKARQKYGDDVYLVEDILEPIKNDMKLHNWYRGTDLGYGGYVYAEPGMYGNIALLDVASLHPHSIIAMNCFGEYTQYFKDILDARMYIKHKDFDAARHMLNGKLAPYLDDESTAKDLAQALKIAINSVYGLTSASFDNPFRDIRNKNNIVALRGALFMRTLQDEVKAKGHQVVHIKTDSIKIADANPEIIDFCMDFAKKYKYTFEHEATYDRMCLVNDAVYIAKYADPHPGEWTATGKQFAVPYVFKSLFSKEDIEFQDMCETFSVSKGALYLDMNEELPDVSGLEKELDKIRDKFAKGKLSDTTYESECSRLVPDIEKGHDLQFVGRVGQFTPIKSGYGGGVLYRVNEGKNYAASGSTGFRWLESERVSHALDSRAVILDPETGEEITVARRELADGINDIIDRSFYEKLVNDAIDVISKYGDFEWFVSDDPYIPKPKLPDFMNIPEDAPEEVPWD